MSGFHGAFATGVASQQGTLTLPDTWFRPPFWDLLMLLLLRPNSSNLSCLSSTFHLEYHLVLSRFCLLSTIFPGNDYAYLFEGLGCLPGTHSIKLDPKVTPVVYPPRKIPISLMDKVRAKLNRMEQMGVIVKQTEPKQWVNSMVVVNKG